MDTATQRSALRIGLTVALGAVIWILPVHTRGEDHLPPAGARILFLGDSITFGGEYIDQIDLFLRKTLPDGQYDVVNCGLPSETVSGLSEDGHAGGAFPRPTLHERLDRVLQTAKPDLVCACYGINCGIYLPFDEDRFAKYKAGIEKLHAAVEKSGAQIVHLTPALFDKGPAEMAKPGFDYDDVLTRYSEWLLDQRSRGWRVADVHTAMRQDLTARRETVPSFRYANDGVHVNGEGHAAIARAVLSELTPDRVTAFDDLFRGDWARSPAGQTARKFVRQRNELLRNAYLSAAGHKRPGIAAGQPLEEAVAKAAELSAAIQKSLQ